MITIKTLKIIVEIPNRILESDLRHLRFRNGIHHVVFSVFVSPLLRLQIIVENRRLRPKLRMQGRAARPTLRNVRTNGFAMNRGSVCLSQILHRLLLGR